MNFFDHQRAAKGTTLKLVFLFVVAVVAMVEPEIAENTVPATTATTASRPGTCRISRSTPSITLMAKPVWNSTSPIKINSGIGVSEKFTTAAPELRTS